MSFSLSSLISGTLGKIVTAIAPHATPAATPVVTAASTNPTTASVEAAIEAVFDPMTADAIAAIGAKVPILGPVLAGEATVLAESAEHAALAYLIGKLQGYLPTL